MMTISRDRGSRLGGDISPSGGRADGRGGRQRGQRRRDHFSPKSTSETGKVGRREIARKLVDPLSYHPYCNIWKTWENISLGHSISNKFLGSLSL